jgi:hypothetical protein
MASKGNGCVGRVGICRGARQEWDEGIVTQGSADAIAGTRPFRWAYVQDGTPGLDQALIDTKAPLHPGRRQLRTASKLC